MTYYQQLIKFDGQLRNHSPKDLKLVGDTAYQLIPNQVVAISYKDLDIFTSSYGANIEFEAQMENGDIFTALLPHNEFKDVLNTIMAGTGYERMGTLWYETHNVGLYIDRLKCYLDVNHEKSNSALDEFNRERENALALQSLVYEPGVQITYGYANYMYICDVFTSKPKSTGYELTAPSKMKLFMKKHGELALFTTSQLKSATIPTTETQYELTPEEVIVLLNKGSEAYLEHLFSINTTSLDPMDVTTIRCATYLPTNKSQFVTIPSMEYREYVDKLRLQHTLERARAYDEELLEVKNN